MQIIFIIGAGLLRESKQVFSVLNMRTASRDDPPSTDLNTHAKIRSAAIEHFAKDGFQKANLRAIAATAGVSAGSVIHHFGSKEGLRRACDEYVLRDLIRRARDETSPAGLQDVVRNYLENPAEFQIQIGYLARAISEDSPAARQFVDTLVDESEAIITAGIANGSMRPSSDPRVLAVLIAMTSLAMLTLTSHLARSLGYESRGPELMRRMALPSLELYTNGLYTDDTFLKATQDALATAQPRERATSTKKTRTERTKP